MTSASSASVSSSAEFVYLAENYIKPGWFKMKFAVTNKIGRAMNDVKLMHIWIKLGKKTS